MRFVLPLLFVLTIHAHALSDSQLAQIGHKVWVNECDGTVAGLTAWNAGENFASLGIGHFIWAPRGIRVPFEESFPKLVRFLDAQGVKTPGLLHGACPWSTRAEFHRAIASPERKALRELLAATIPQQAAFLAERMRDSLPKMLAISSAPERVRSHFHALLGSSRGTFALIDYVNFKGEGVLATERSHGEGWGLLQVLETMSAPDVDAFAAAAAQVLTRRVRNAPGSRHEQQWLPGWKNRVARY